MKPKHLIAWIVSVGLLSGTGLRAQDVIISEFMAVNQSAVVDEDGDYSDWVEIANLTGASVNLDGWFLTDDAEDLSKWRFPAVILPARERLVVFASDKARVDPRRELHANFRLDSRGEFLALVDPLGQLVSGFAPAYPPQVADVSFGFPQGVFEETSLVAGAPVRAFVPSSDVLGASWRGTTFNDAAWTMGTTGVGYDVGTDYDDLIGLDVEAGMHGVNSSVFIRVPFTVTDASILDAIALSMKYDDGYVAYVNGQEVARRNAPVGSPQWNWAATSEHGEASFGSLSQDFDGGGTSFVLTQYGDPPAPALVAGGPSGTYVRLLVDNVGGLTNTIGFARRFTEPATFTVIEFDYRMSAEAGYSGNERADGFGVALLGTAEYGNSGAGPSVPGVVWERPSLPDAFAVGFDIYNGQRTENSVSLHFNGGEVTSSLVTAFDLNNGVFNRVRIELTSDLTRSYVSVSVTPDSLGTPGAPVSVFQDVIISGMAPFENRLAFGGRTGGETVGVDLDNISVEYTHGEFAIPFETVDISEHLSALQDGQNVLAIQGLNVSAADADFLTVPEIHAVSHGSIDLGSIAFFPEPTPGLPNNQGFPGISKQPILSHASGAFSAAFNLSILAGTPGATVRYTLDGSEPTEKSPAYAGTIRIDSTTIVKARSFDEGLFPSLTEQASFFRLGSGMSTFSSNLPLVIVETYGRGIGSSVYTTVSSLFIPVAEDGRASVLDPASYAGNGGIQIRGSSSQGFPKKMYKFETWDAYGEDLDVPLLGMPAESDWVLYGPYSDKALMRNYLSYSWGNEMERYAPRTLFFEMFLSTNGGTVDLGEYVGTYVLIEKIKRGDDRVDIAELLPSDSTEPEVTGGYILKKDRLDPGDVGFTTSRGQVLGFVEPKEREITTAQRAYLTSFFRAFEDALYGANFKDPEEGYAKYIDVDSFIDNHIMVELTKNIDGYRLSTYMYKDRGGKLTMGPIWDYNLSLGNANYLQGWLAQGWYYTQVGGDGYPWYARLFQDPDFIQRYTDRWTALRRGVFQTPQLIAWVDDTADIIWESQLRNFNKWPILGSYVWPNWFVANTYQEELNFMKTWLTDRLDWIDRQYPEPPTLNPNGGAIPAGGLVLAMATSAGTIYYTLDGTDPRLPGGAVSNTALSYGSGSQSGFIQDAVATEVRVLVPASGSLGSSWTSVTFNDSSWGGGTGGTGVGYEVGSGYESFIDWDVEGSLYNQATSVYIRVPFQVEEPESLTSLVLQMMYDDGFAAYLNGQRVASVNAPAVLAWDSQADGQHNDGEAVVYEDFNLTPYLDLLRPGVNVLAIHGLNAGAGSSDMLIRCQLFGAGVASGDSLSIDTPTEVHARTYNAGSWSGLSREVFVLDVPVPLRVTELMYRPQALEPGSPYSRDDFEFVELRNVGAQTVDLLGVRFTRGIDFDFSRSAIRYLNPGEHLVLVEDMDAFLLRYGGLGIPIGGRYGGNLDNGGETVTLIDGRGELIQEFTYDDLWYPSTDGTGYSLHIADAYAPADRWNTPQAWAPSIEIGGSPGLAESDVELQGWQMPGDMNQDARADISDAVALLQFLFTGGGPGLPCDGALDEDSASRALLDLNGSTTVDLSDAVFLLNFLFAAGSEPVLGSDCVSIPGCPNVCVR